VTEEIPQRISAKILSFPVKLKSFLKGVAAFGGLALLMDIIDDLV